MMPIFFNLESHLWIAYLLFLNGFLLSYCLATWSVGYRELVSNLEAQVLAAFSLSLGLNGVVLLVADTLAMSWQNLLPVFVCVTSAALILTCYRFLVCRQWALTFDRILWFRVGLYLLAFVILFYNGGLIEQISDAWWHMSLANEMVHSSSFTLERGHLDGISQRYYPPLWHGNLALLRSLSGEQLPVIWNSFTAWGAVLKLMGVYLFALALGRNTALAVLAAVMFMLLPGIGISYMRVSAWPSHVAYALWFALFYVVFCTLYSVTSKVQGSVVGELKSLFARHHAAVAVAVVLLIQIALTHQLELVWFFVAMLGFAFVQSMCQRSAGGNLAGSYSATLYWFFQLSVVVIVCYTMLLLGEKAITRGVSIDKALAHIIPASVLGLCSLALIFKRRRVSVGILIVAAVLFLFTVDYKHLVSLFVPDMALPSQGYRQQPLLAEGLFDGVLFVPGWHLQLREGFLFAGILAIPIAVVMAYLKPTVMNLFLAVNAVLAFAFCVSPYFYQWLTDVLRYHSAWRVAILLFTPLVLAQSIFFLWARATDKSYSKGSRRMAGGLTIALALIVAKHALVHFDGRRVDLKQQSSSAQRHWSVFYGQHYVYTGASFKYQSDIDSLRGLLPVGAIVLTDISTSYYLAAELPITVKNLHLHHRMASRSYWERVLRRLCYLDQEENKSALALQFSAMLKRGKPHGVSSGQYFVVNKDQNNNNMQNDCLSQRRRAFINNYQGLAALEFDGEYLMLFRFLDSASDRHAGK
ncbi:hypothetical protein GCM10008090_04770 [Arenicella chitinivorans]|uniref:Uncharacterized protein n=1 Tax=Arenicella chitinivorans TaxID=1329800 RepID=A0A918VHI0_9GAMM|nr:DUF6541 family protein [Arenicella chitinivorans]GGZ99234.1 hypothetical protein GCM10008090_04770 [Arenicella chitinivorans]